MSGGRRIPWEEAYELAERAVEDIGPTVERLKAVGSLRRRKPAVSDIEFVAEPRQVTVDLFGGREPDVEAVRAALVQMGAWVKGGERMLQITDLYGLDGFFLEVYLVHPPAQWGSIVAIRTGPAELGQLAVSQMRGLGYQHRDGRVVRKRDGETVPTPEEEDFFRLAGIPCVPPAERDELYWRIRKSILPSGSAP